MSDRPRALALLIAVFLLGCIIGAAGSYFWTRKLMPPPFPMSRDMNPQRIQGRPRLPELLKLTPDQEARRKEIMAESRRQLDALRANQIAQIEAIRMETNKKLSAILNEEQRKKFSAFLKEIEDRRMRSPRGRGFGPPPPRAPEK